MSSNGTLTRGEVRKVLRIFREAGSAIPPVGWTCDLPEAARDVLRSKETGRTPTRIVHACNGWWVYRWER